MKFTKKLYKKAISIILVGMLTIGNSSDTCKFTSFLKLNHFVQQHEVFAGTKSFFNKLRLKLPKINSKKIQDAKSTNKNYIQEKDILKRENYMQDANQDYIQDKNLLEKNTRNMSENNIENFNQEILNRAAPSAKPDHTWSNSMIVAGSWSESGTQDDPYRIESETDFGYFCYEANYGNAVNTNGKYYKLYTDIDLGYESWTPLINFKGILDGNGKIISRLLIDQGSIDGVGLFGTMQNGTIKNLHIKDCYILGRDNVGAFVGFLDAYDGAANGIDGETYVINCSSEGIIRGHDNVGGIVGWNFLYRSGDLSTANITGCVNRSVVTGVTYVGGIVGESYYHHDDSVNPGSDSFIEDCYNFGNVTGYKSVGGITGFNHARGFQNGHGSMTVNNCHNSGTVSGYRYVGGVVGDNHVFEGAQVVISNCYNSGKVYGLFDDVLDIDSSDIDERNTAGGVVGLTHASSGGMIQVNNCFNTGNVDGINYVGGVVGNNYRIENDSDVIVQNCYNTAQIKGVREIGGVCGSNSSSANGTAIIMNCYNTGNILGNNYVGGVVGNNYSKTNEAQTFILSCYNTGKVDFILDSNAILDESRLRFGALVGANKVEKNNSSEIKACYYNLETCGQDKAIGFQNDSESNINIIALNTEEMVGDAAKIYMKMLFEDYEVRLDVDKAFAEPIANDQINGYAYYPELSVFSTSRDSEIRDLSKFSVRIAMAKNLLEIKDQSQEIIETDLNRPIGLFVELDENLDQEINCKWQIKNNNNWEDIFNATGFIYMPNTDLVGENIYRCVINGGTRTLNDNITWGANGLMNQEIQSAEIKLIVKENNDHKEDNNHEKVNDHEREERHEKSSKKIQINFL